SNRCRPDRNVPAPYQEGPELFWTTVIRQTRFFYDKGDEHEIAGDGPDQGEYNNNQFCRPSTIMPERLNSTRLPVQAPGSGGIYNRRLRHPHGDAHLMDSGDMLSVPYLLVAGDMDDLTP
ncbi:MAG: hypothetical protein OEY85_14995, partial [Rhodospirillales bacterium]|nr:hypothetical protein [Rhodospirillales bacterium]